MQDVNLLISADDNHAPYAAATIRSAVKSKSEDDRITAYVLTLGFSPETEKKFSELALDLGAAVKIINVDADLVESLPDKSRTKTAYLRIFAGDLLPNVGRAIYLDTDILVRASLTTLMTMPIDAAAAVVDAACYTGWSGLANEVPESFDRSKYFNSGVLVMNLAYFRENSAGSKISIIRQAIKTSVLHDQSALNIFLEGKISYISASYNYMPHFYDKIVIENRQYASVFSPYFDNPKIIHFSHYMKPWHRNFVVRFAHEYQKHLEQTPWGADAFTKMTVKKRAARIVRSLDFARRYYPFYLKRFLAHH